jgi:hypothetical protein
MKLAHTVLAALLIQSSWLGMETPRLRTVFGALPRFGLAPLRRRALAVWLLAMERRLIASPRLGAALTRLQ